MEILSPRVCPKNKKPLQGRGFWIEAKFQGLYFIAIHVLNLTIINQIALIEPICLHHYGTAHQRDPNEYGHDCFHITLRVVS